MKNTQQIVKNLGMSISKNSPTILTGIAVGGLITTTILAVKATPKALTLIDNALYDREGENYGIYSENISERIQALGYKDTWKITWKCYIPTCAVGIATIACVIGANQISLQRNAALASVYAITETAFKEYQNKITETIGKNKEQKIRDEISADNIKTNPPGVSEVIFTGKGDVLCLDSLSGRYFKSEMEHIRRCINTINKELMSENWIGLNELYFTLGLSGTKLGDELGWDIDRGLLEVDFSSQLTEEGEPCLVINYKVGPRFY